MRFRSFLLLSVALLHYASPAYPQSVHVQPRQSSNVIITLSSSDGLSAQSVAIVRVVRVIDGDTIEVCCIQGKQERVRYIGIDTPETKHPMKEVEYYGEEAAEANRKLVEGKTVRLEFDVQERDRYGRDPGLRLPRGWDFRKRLACRTRVRSGYDDPAECEASGVIFEVTAGGEGGWAKVVEVKPPEKYNCEPLQNVKLAF